VADLDGDMSAMCINYSFLYIYSYLGLFNLPYTIPIKSIYSTTNNQNHVTVTLRWYQGSVKTWGGAQNGQAPECMRVRCGAGVSPSSLRRGMEDVSAPFSENYFNFAPRNANFGAFSDIL